MKKPTLSAKEFEVIEQVSNSPANQRLIAEQAGISLGLTNLIIKRLARKGYLKLKQLNRRNLRYLLTPKGIAEKTRWVYSSTLRIIETLREMKGQIQELILSQYQKGAREFVIKGRGELSDLIEIAFKSLNLNGVSYACLDSIEHIKDSKVVILLTEQNLNTCKKIPNRTINIIKALAERA